MLTQEQVQHVVAPRPKSYAALMEMYEINYIQMRLLFGDLRNIESTWVGNSAAHLPLLVELKEKSRYTQTLLLTYQFPEPDKTTGSDTRPDLLVRIYHDACQAEVVTVNCHFSRKPSKYWWQHQDTMLLCRWRMNRFLFKWISYLRHHNYDFQPLIEDVDCTHSV